MDAITETGYGFERENLVSSAKLAEFWEKLGELTLAHKKKAERNSPGSVPGTQ